MKYLLISILSLLFSLNAWPQTIMQKRECIYQAASSQVGIRENPLGSNKGKEVEKYLKDVGLTGGYAWCAAFTTWCYNQCQPLPANFPKTAWAPAYAKPDKIIYSRGMQVKRKGITTQPKQSDLYFVFDYYARRIGHIGIIEDWNPQAFGNSYLTTIEGNTNDNGGSEGIGVYRKVRSKRMVFQVANWFE